MSPRDAYERWQEQNREFLVLAVDDLHARTQGDPVEDLLDRTALDALLERMEHPPALLSLAAQLDLGPFERDLLLLCFAAELDPRFRIDLPPVTVGSALELLDDAHWTAIDEGAPLRTWGIVEVDATQGLAIADAPIRLARDVVRYLMGFDPRVGGDLPLTPLPGPPAVVERQAALAHELATAVARTFEVTGEWPVVQLHGAAEEDRLAAAALLAAALGGTLVSVDARDLPQPGAELDTALRTWSRIVRITASLLCVTTAETGDEEDPALRHRMDKALAGTLGPLVLATPKPATTESARPSVRREVLPLDAGERLQVWGALTDDALGRLGARRTKRLDDALAALAADFRLTARAMQRIALDAEAEAAATSEQATEARDRLPGLLRTGCARAIRARLDPLADRVTVTETTEVFLPEREARQLAELEVAIRLGEVVGTGWGLGRGAALGTTALFAGPSGTGKTHAALALARRLGLDLYRVDLARVLSKYIGETERNLDRIFDAAESGGVILLFDEADALFGKRSEVRDSHDRYANIGVSYLLMRLERTPAPTILTTNLKDAIDPAFLRRLLVVVDFPFPAPAEREAIWRSVYPPHTPVAELDPERLRRVTVTGATISNIALRGAYLAAADDDPVDMGHLLEATQRELRKTGRELTPEERSAWPPSA